MQGYGLAWADRAPADNDRVGAADIANREPAGRERNLGLQARDVALRVRQRHRIAVGAPDRSAARIEFTDDGLRQQFVAQRVGANDESHLGLTGVEGLLSPDAGISATSESHSHLRAIKP